MAQVAEKAGEINENKSTGYFGTEIALSLKTLKDKRKRKDKIRYNKERERKKVF